MDPTPQRSGSSPRRSSLRSYLLAGGALVIVVQLVTGGLIVRAGTDIATESADEGAVAAAQAAAGQVEMTFAFAHQLIIAGARRPGLIQFLETRDEPPIQDVVDVIYRDTPYYAST